MPAANGVASALLVADGCTGVEDAFSGKQDFFSIYSANADRDALVRDWMARPTPLTLRAKAGVAAAQALVNGSGSS